MPYVAPTQPLIAGNLLLHHLVGSPADDIVSRAGHELWLPIYTANLTVLVRKLCDNFYHYGRNNGWIWGAFNANRTGGDPTSVGFPLISNSLFTQTNCGGFNAALRQIASKVLGVGDDLLDGSNCADRFMTRPGTVGIDAAWSGNVRTIDDDFDHFACYGFTNHSWSRIVGTGLMYDASTNTLDFNQKTDLMWATVKKWGNGELMELDQVHNPVVIPGRPPYIKARIGYLKANLAMIDLHGRLNRAFVTGLPEFNDPASYWPASIVVSAYDLSSDLRRANGVY